MRPRISLARLASVAMNLTRVAVLSGDVDVNRLTSAAVSKTQMRSVRTFHAADSTLHPTSYCSDKMNTSPGENRFVAYINDMPLAFQSACSHRSAFPANQAQGHFAERIRQNRDEGGLFGPPPGAPRACR
jgi:hypothetical protein